MTTFSIGSKLRQKKAAPFYLFFHEADASWPKEIVELAKTIAPSPLETLKAMQFAGKQGEVMLTTGFESKQLINFVVAGLGKKEGKKSRSLEHYRRTLGSAYKKLVAAKADEVTIALPDHKLFGITAAHLAEQTVVALTMASYHFDDYLTDQSRKNRPIKSITLITDESLQKEVAAGVERGEIIANAVNTTRHWVDLPPVVVTPEFLAKKAQAIAKEHGLKVTVFSEAEIIKMGMGGLAGVSRGSELDCKLVILEYQPKKKNAKKLAIVGKGITFDSGGLSLKPASAMETMKEDMSGAAAVINTMQAIAQLKPDLHVIALAPIAENLPSGTATKPGDILRFYNGKTAEVKNTDAEGRLILADALSYAVKHYQPDAMIDVATLTGACSYALGPYFTGLMSPDDQLTQKVIDAADRAGERVWRLPMDDDFMPAIRSEVADICNAGSARYRAGAITAAFFLKHFVDQTPWVHLDIAGTAFDVPNISYYQSGATGAGVRLLIELATMDW